MEHTSFLYVIIIISSILQLNFLLLTFILTLFGWIGITYYMKEENLQGKGA
ncbi:MAG: hypothetical protein IPG09_15230 [Ignavibacteria bacterium]|nr:hypothetical protein [Ignavibacteria bacterium]